MEIEKKYRILQFPEELERIKGVELEQGYLCTSPVVRIRRMGEEYILTYKARIPEKEHDREKREKNIHINEEIEMPLTKESYEHLREKTDGNLIRKTRYRLPLEDGKTAELDVFHGYLDKLVFVEVEFSSVKEAEDFQPPYWFGEDVSGDYRYSNSYLSVCDSPFWL